MFNSAPIIVGLETGTSKICAVVGEVSASGALNIIGIGQSKSRGVRKGEIVDTSLAEEDIRNAIVEAEHMANVEIRDLLLGVTGCHIQGTNNRGVHTVLSADREITKDDVQDVIKNARAINLPPSHHVIHAVRQHFLVDGQKNIEDPVGMMGTRMEVDMHVVHGHKFRLQNSFRIIKNLQLEVENLVFNGLASALAVLTHEQKQMGSLVIDFGAGTTEYVVYSNGIIKHSGVLAVGGDHVTNDLAVGLKIPLQYAEKLKLSHGRAMMDSSIKGQTVTLCSENGVSEGTINLEHLCKIMTVRLEEIFELIAADLEKAELLDEIRAGVFLCGGGSRISQIHHLAEKILQMPSYQGRTSTTSGIKNALDQPEFTTAIGLVRFGGMQLHQRRAQSAMVGGFASRISRLFGWERKDSKAVNVEF